MHSPGGGGRRRRGGRLAEGARKEVQYNPLPPLPLSFLDSRNEWRQEQGRRWYEGRKRGAELERVEQHGWMQRMGKEEQRQVVEK